MGTPRAPETSTGLAARSLTQLFELQASVTPDAIALSFGASQVSYAELDRRANQLAHQLRRLGVGAESLVGLFVERSVEMVVAVLGILKAGGAYVPVDATNPPDRADVIFRDAAVAAIVGHSALLSRVSMQTPVVSLDRDAAALAQLPSQSPAVAVEPGNAAYVIYTSGSTGQPKGVVVTHRNVLRLLSETRQWYDFGPTDVWPLFHSIAFDVSVWELWGALLRGGRLVVVPQDVTRSPEQFHELLRTERVTVLNQTPSAFRMLMPTALRAGRVLSLRYVVFAGEALAFSSLKPWVALYGDDAPQLINMYGITETTVHVTYRRVRADDLDGGSYVGVPIPDLGFHLLDEQQKPVPDGVEGEIYVTGPGVARGYLNRPELNAARFLADPFSSDAGARMYRSGDAAKRLPNGEIEYLGRLDTQVKIRGFRIELGEIESALRRHEAVKDAVVVARDDVTGQEKVLIGYFTTDTGAPEPTATELRNHLIPRLPEYMVPSRFVRLAAIPLTVNGKTDRRALPAPERKRPALARPFAPPATRVQAWIAARWAAILDIESVGVNDPFFELGGSSLTAVRLLADLGRDLGSQLPTLLLFRAATVAQMADILESEHRDALGVVIDAMESPLPSYSTALAPLNAASLGRAARERAELQDRRARRRRGV